MGLRSVFIPSAPNNLNSVLIAPSEISPLPLTSLLMFMVGSIWSLLLFGGLPLGNYPHFSYITWVSSGLKLFFIVPLEIAFIAFFSSLVSSMLNYVFIAPLKIFALVAPTFTSLKLATLFLVLIWIIVAIFICSVECHFFGYLYLWGLYLCLNPFSFSSRNNFFFIFFTY